MSMIALTERIEEDGNPLVDGFRLVDIGFVGQAPHRSERRMMTITISPKFQIVIPKAIREALSLKPGQRIQAIVYEDRIELIPVRRLKDMRGFLSGIDTRVDRDADRA